MPVDRQAFEAMVQRQMSPPPTSVAEIIASERFRAFAKGWKDRSGSRLKDVRFIEHETRRDLADAYERGWREAQAAQSAAMSRYAAEVGYDQAQAILR